MNILLCTLGQSWAVIPEIYALLAPEQCPLYQQHPQHEAIEAVRQRYDLTAPDELWVVTTAGDDVTSGLERLQGWCRGLPQPPQLRAWRTTEVGDIASEAEGNRVRELIYRAVLLASERLEGGRLFLSLAGGRKTMSADLQSAGMQMGCHALLHVIAPPVKQLSERLRRANPEDLLTPLATEDCHGLLPLVVGVGRRSELLDVNAGDTHPICSRDYPLPFPEDTEIIDWPGDDRSLPAELEQREQESGRLLGNYLETLVREEPHGNWRSLYRLPPRTIDALRQKRLDGDDEDWLRALPKVDLHRHIGGAIGLAAQRKVGAAIWEDLAPNEQAAALDAVSELLKTREWPWDWPRQIRSRDLPRSHQIAALLVHADDAALQHNLWQVTEINGRRFALKSRHQEGFSAYERPGELAGSALLGHPAALRPYLSAVLAGAHAEGLWYLELRGSPHKYRDTLTGQLEFLREIRDQVASEAQMTPPLLVRFIIIADRRNSQKAEQAVNLAVQARQELGDFVVGLDIAGDESADSEQSARLLADKFDPAFAACLPITIHAGEGEPADKIWAAAYRLHADRVGHGLTLNQHADLRDRFRDRSLCLELCPTSNLEVVGFHHPDLPESRGFPRYPLMDYWRYGLTLTLCTDNPGISRTTLAREYITASRLSTDGISRWQALAMIRQGFRHAFLPADLRSRIIKQADATIYRLHIRNSNDDGPGETKAAST